MGKPACWAIAGLSMLTIGIIIMSKVPQVTEVGPEHGRLSCSKNAAISSRRLAI